MATLVIAEHDQREHPARDPQHRHRGSGMRRRRPRAGGRPRLWTCGQGRRADHVRDQGDLRRRRAAGPWLGRERRGAGAGHRLELQPHPVPGDGRRQERGPARGGQAGRRADQRHQQGRQPRHLRAPDLRRQRHRHGAEQRCHQGDHRAHHRLRSGGGHRRQRRGRDRGRGQRGQRQEQASSATRSPRAIAPN
jgi:hypothetical protein